MSIPSNDFISDPNLNQTINFSFKQPQNDQSTMLGRFLHFQRVVDPRNFFVTQQGLLQSVKLVREYQELENSSGKSLLLSKNEHTKLLRAINIKSSAIQNETGEEIPRMMRMCAFVPMNVPILFGMLLSSPTVFNTVFWQWFNQSFNAGLNYGNRNPSSPYTTKDLAFGYSAAVGSSVTVALILRKLFSNVTRSITGSKLILINSFVSAIASGSAGFLNAYCMRKVEMVNGIDVYSDEQLTQKVGISKVCAKKAIIETGFSRIFLSISCLMSPAFIFYLIDRTGRTPKARVPKMMFDVGVFLFSLMVSLPASIALFPQTGTMKIADIEKEIGSDYSNLNRVYYNKGL